jgi:hypothetical protein
MFIVSSLPFQLVGSFDDIDARLVVQVELDARTGEIVSISGDRDAIRKTCSFLLEAVGTQGTRHGQDHGDGNRQVHGLGAHTARGNGLLLDTATNNTEAAFVGTASTGRLSDQEVRDRARPANILAALRREREFPQAATRFVDHECERELRSTSTSPETSERDWEIPREVDRRDERTMECAPFNARQNPDARSGGNGNAAGPSPAGLDSDLHQKNTRELVSRRDAFEASALDAFPPRSSGEGDLARGFPGADRDVRDPEFVRGDSPVGGASAVTNVTASIETDGRSSDLDRGAGRDRSETCRRSRRNFVLDASGHLRLVPAALDTTT